jgi:predicted ATP-dependent endonuclease of OLD family
MNYYIKHIRLDKEFSKYTLLDKLQNEQDAIRNLSKINIFVGANNSGKSRFLRQLSCTQKFIFTPSTNLGEFSFVNIDLCKCNFLINITQLFTNAGFEDMHSIRHNLAQIPSLNLITEGAEVSNPLLNIVDYILNLESFNINDCKLLPTQLWHPRMTQEMARLLIKIKNLTTECKKEITIITKVIPAQFHFYTIYIPTLRGLRTSKENTDDFYQAITAADYFPRVSPGNPRPEIFTGLSLFTEVRELLLGNLADREIIADFQKFLAESFFEGKPVALIPKKGNTVLDIKIGDEAERPVFNLGDGIQSIIIFTFPLFKNKGKKLLFFCEEPELYMHPGLQRIFLTVLNRFPDYQYFLTTHSNHFLDITLDLPNVSVYTFTKELTDTKTKEKDARFNIENVSNEDKRILELLGVRNSSVFLSNCTIWVEGITDRLYFAHYLKLFQESSKFKDNAFKIFKEDLHFSFVEYGGANITHWSFLDDGYGSTIDVTKLCGKLFLITDRDNETNDAKQKRAEKLKEKLKDRYCCLKCREIENLLTAETIRKVVMQYEGENSELNDFTQDDYKNEFLGEFIETKVLSSERKRKGSYANDSGTISDKVNFCHRAIEQIKSFDDLSEEAQEIAKRIYDFIQENNK